MRLSQFSYYLFTGNRHPHCDDLDIQPSNPGHLRRTKSKPVRQLLPLKLWSNAQRKLDLLKAATDLDSLRVSPGNRLEKLVRDLDGYFSIRINDQYRIVFAFDDEGGRMMSVSPTITKMLKDEGLPIKRMPVHPGEFLLHEFLEPLGITQKKLATDLGWKVGKVNEIIKGKRGLTEDSAILLSRYFGMSVTAWLNLQHNYDLAKAIHHVDTKRIRNIGPIGNTHLAGF